MPWPLGPGLPPCVVELAFLFLPEERNQAGPQPLTVVSFGKAEGFMVVGSSKGAWLSALQSKCVACACLKTRAEGAVHVSPALQRWESATKNAAGVP